MWTEFTAKRVALGVGIGLSPWVRGFLVGYAVTKVATKAARAIWTTPQARITKNSADAASELELPPTAPVRCILHDVESDDQVELMRQLAAECFAGNPIPGRRRNRMSAFYRYWVSATRLEFPLRADRPSDRGAMSKWLAGQMRAAGIRTTHAADAIPKVVALAINPSRAEVEAAQWADEARLRTVGGAFWRKLVRIPLGILGLLPQESSRPPPGFG